MKVTITATVREVDRHYLLAHLWNPYWLGTWCAQAEQIETDGLRRVWQVLGPEHPWPGATGRDYYKALTEGRR